MSFMSLANIERALGPLAEPDYLFVPGVGGCWFDPADLSTLFQDSAGTTPVTADGQPVGLMLDKSGNGNHAVQSDNSRRPIYKTDGVRHWIEFNRTDLQWLSLPVDLFRNLPGAAVAVGCRFDNVTVNGAVLFVSSSAASGTRVYIGRFNDPGLRVIARRVNTDDPANVVLVPEPGAGADYSMEVGLGYTDGVVKGYVDGDQVVSGNFAAAGNSADTDSDYVAIGRSLIGTTSNHHFSGRLYSLLVRSPGLSDLAVKRIDYYTAKTVADTATPSEINVFLVAGQSNTDGRVVRASGPAWINDGLVSGVKVWNGSALVEYSLSSVGPTGNGSSWVQSQSVNRFSFAHVALHGIAAALDNVVACQVTSGGTSIAPRSNVRGSWCPNYDLIPEGTPALLSALHDRFMALKAYCVANGIALNVRGFLWHQGESDSVAAGATSGDEDAYQERLEDLIAFVREFTEEPELPVYMGTVAHESLWYGAKIETAHLAIAAAHEHVHCRDNSDLDLLNDNLHFDADSSVTFGDWAADECVSELVS